MSEPGMLALAVEPCWSVEAIQAANWGGFHGGGHEMPFAVNGTTLLSGASGAGKSSLLDAYLAVMMPTAALRFNEASNDTAGRARDARTGQRTILDYVRGKTGEHREGGEMRRDVLRGQDRATWSAVAVKFVNDRGDLFTAARVYFAGRAATSDTEVKSWGITAETHVDIDRLAGLATNTGFDKDAVVAHLGVQWLSRRDFESAVQLHLGIGGATSGAEALQLLSRIQAGKAMDSSVDQLFKELVLGRPATFDYADIAVTEFTRTEAAFREAREAGDKRDTLVPITEWHEQQRQHNLRVHLLESLGAKHPASDNPPIRRWAHGAEFEIVSAAIEANRAEADLLIEDQRVVGIRRANAQGRVERLQISRSNVAEGILVLEGTLKAYKQTHERARTDRATFARRTAVLDVTVDSEERFRELTAAATAFLRTAADRKQALHARQKPFYTAFGTANATIEQLTQERELLERSRGRMLPALLKARETIARATGMTEDELPFVGELLDINPSLAQWRTAAEVTLSAVTKVMLVDAERLAEFSATIDALQIPNISYQGVDLNQEPTGSPRTGRISEVLEFDHQSPFIGWVIDRVCQPHADALRVQNPRDLGGDQLKVTAAGQTRYGRRGSAGTANIARVIGFTNESRLAEIDADLATANHQRDQANTAINKIGAEINHHDQVHAAHQMVIDTRWEHIDEAGAADAVTVTVTELARLRDDNPQLQQIDHALKQANEDLATAVAALTRLSDRLTDLQNDYDRFVVREETLSYAAADAKPVAEHHRAELDRLYATRDPSETGYSIEGFQRTVREIAREIEGEIRSAATARDLAIAELTGIFKGYDGRWHDDPNRGIGVESYPQYLKILEQISADEVYRLDDHWKQLMDDQTGTHLVELIKSYEAARDDIDDRLDPIRTILQRLPFGEHGHRLDLILEDIPSREVADFHSRIYALTRELSAVRTDDEYAERYAEMKDIIEQIRKPEYGRAGAARRNRLLNVNDHIRITAAAYDVSRPTPVEVKHYDMISSLSGGEWQELVAFVAAAALRFRLGDSGNERPRYAPVILDEAFIKANGEFASRGINAWRNLGFQLIIAAPQDKVTGIESLMDELRCITKEHGYSHISRYTKNQTHP